MADFAPPTGPPPPKVPEGWKVIWNDQYKEWFYVNIYTKKSQWEKPDSPVYPPGEGGDSEALPAYDHSTTQPVQPEKTGSSTGAAMFGAPGVGSSAHHDLSADEALARKLQEEENARLSGGAPSATASKGASDSYYNNGQAQQYGQAPQYNQQQQGYASNELPPDTRGKSKGGFLGKLLGKGKASQQQPQQQYYPQQGYPPHGYPPQQGYYPGGAAAAPGRKPGMGAGGAAALGVGGGLLGGMLLADAMEGHHGGDDGGYGGGDGGGDGGGYGGGDDGGFGGDDGGGGFDDGGGDF